MKKLIPRTTCAALLLAAMLCSTPAVQKPKTSPVTSVTGTYKYILNSLEVLELPEHKVRISFNGLYPNSKARAETRNVGTFDETVALSNRTATVTLQYGSEPCAITISFSSNKAVVEQSGSLQGCGFGFNVEPDGVYRKVSSKRQSLTALK